MTEEEKLNKAYEKFKIARAKAIKSGNEWARMYTHKQILRIKARLILLVK